MSENFGKKLEDSAVLAVQVSVSEIITSIIRAIPGLFAGMLTQNKPKEEAMAGEKLPFSMNQTGQNLKISANSNTVLRIHIPERFGKVSDLSSKVVVSLDEANNDLVFTTKKGIDIDETIPVGFKFGESQDGEAIEVDYEIALPPLGWMHIPALLAWKPSTGTLDIKLFKSVGTNI